MTSLNNGKLHNTWLGDKNHMEFNSVAYRLLKHHAVNNGNNESQNF